MRNMIKTLLIILAIAFLASSGFAEEKNLWEQDFVMTLQKAKNQPNAPAGGYGYTETEEAVLEKAIKTALDAKAPPCQAMKIAIELKYSEYEVIKNVFTHGSELDLDQLCMCANEKNVSAQLIAQAATDSQRFTTDEVTESKCFQGLGYGTAAAPLQRIIPPGPPDPVSTSAPGGGGEEEPEELDS